MSTDDVEVVRRSWEAWERGGLDELATFWHRDVDWRAVPGAPDDRGVIRGRDAVRAYFAEWLELFDDFTATAEELADAGDGVVADVHVRGRGGASGITTDMRFATVYTVRDGLIVRGREYATREEALRAAGG